MGQWVLEIGVSENIKDTNQTREGNQVSSGARACSPSTGEAEVGGSLEPRRPTRATQWDLVSKPAESNRNKANLEETATDGLGYMKNAVDEL